MDFPRAVFQLLEHLVRQQAPDGGRSADCSPNSQNGGLGAGPDGTLLSKRFRVDQYTSERMQCLLSQARDALPTAEKNDEQVLQKMEQKFEHITDDLKKKIRELECDAEVVRRQNAQLVANSNAIQTNNQSQASSFHGDLSSLSSELQTIKRVSLSCERDLQDYGDAIGSINDEVNLVKEGIEIRIRESLVPLESAIETLGGNVQARLDQLSSTQMEQDLNIRQFFDNRLKKELATKVGVDDWETFKESHGTELEYAGKMNNMRIASVEAQISKLEKQLTGQITSLSTNMNEIQNTTTKSFDELAPKITEIRENSLSQITTLECRLEELSGFIDSKVNEVTSEMENMGPISHVKSEGLELKLIALNEELRRTIDQNAFEQKASVNSIKENLKERCTELDNKMQSIQRSQMQNENQITTLKKGQEERCDNLERGLEKCQMVLSDLADNLEARKTSQATTTVPQQVQEELNSMKTNIHSTQTSVSNIFDELSVLKSQTESSCQEITTNFESSLLQHHSTLQQELNSMSESQDQQLEKLSDKVGAFDLLLSTMRQAVSTHGETLGSLDEKVTESGTKMEKYYDNLSTSVNTLNTTVKTQSQSQERKVKEVEERVTGIRTEFEGKVSSIKLEMIDQRKQSQEQIEKMGINQIRSGLTNMKTGFGKLQEDVKRLTSENIADTLKKVISSIADLHGVQSTQDSKINSFQEKLDSWASKFDQLFVTDDILKSEMLELSQLSSTAYNFCQALIESLIKNQLTLAQLIGLIGDASIPQKSEINTNSNTKLFKFSFSPELLPYVEKLNHRMHSNWSIRYPSVKSLLHLIAKKADSSLLQLAAASGDAKGERLFAWRSRSESPKSPSLNQCNVVGSSTVQNQNVQDINKDKIINNNIKDPHSYNNIRPQQQQSQSQTQDAIAQILQQIQESGQMTPRSGRNNMISAISQSAGPHINRSKKVQSTVSDTNTTTVTTGNVNTASGSVISRPRPWTQIWNQNQSQIVNQQNQQCYDSIDNGTQVREVTAQQAGTDFKTPQMTKYQDQMFKLQHTQHLNQAPQQQSIFMQASQNDDMLPQIKTAQTDENAINAINLLKNHIYNADPATSQGTNRNHVLNNTLLQCQGDQQYYYPSATWDGPVKFTNDTTPIRYGGRKYQIPQKYQTFNAVNHNVKNADSGSEYDVTQYHINRPRSPQPGPQPQTLASRQKRTLNNNNAIDTRLTSLRTQSRIQRINLDQVVQSLSNRDSDRGPQVNSDQSLNLVMGSSERSVDENIHSLVLDNC